MSGEVKTIENGGNEDFRTDIDTLEAKMKGLPQVAILPVHYLAHGLYGREITIPAGCLLTGKIHLYEHLNIIAKGDITVATEDGPVRIKAPCVIVSKPGTKRVGYAHEETVWITIHAAEITDVEQAEEILTVEDYETYLAWEGEHNKELPMKEAVCLS